MTEFKLAGSYGTRKSQVKCFRAGVNDATFSKMLKYLEKTYCVRKCEKIDIEKLIIVALQQQLVFHSDLLPFLSVFHVDAENNQLKRNYLIYMLSNDPK